MSHNSKALNQTCPSWRRLFLAIQSGHKAVRIYTYADGLRTKIKAMESAGLKNTVNQYKISYKIII